MQNHLFLFSQSPLIRMRLTQYMVYLTCKIIYNIRHTMNMLLWLIINGQVVKKYHQRFQKLFYQILVHGS